MYADYQTSRKSPCRRLVYKDALEKAKSSVVTHFTTDGTFFPPPPEAQRPSNNTPIHAHYSFDFAQQVFYLNDPLQPGPMYTQKVRHLVCVVSPFPDR